MAPGLRSSATAWIWARTVSAGMAWKPETPIVFWTVTAVIADVPKTPNAWNVLRSAWIPAPPPLSLPAMVRAMGSIDLLRFCWVGAEGIIERRRRREGRSEERRVGKE